MPDKRIGFIDVLRVLAAVAVAATHVVTASSYVSSFPVSGRTEELLEQIHTLLRWSVPVFCMITGFLYLGTDRTCTYRSLVKRILRLLGALLAGGMVYSILEQAFTQRQIGISMIGQAFTDVLSGNVWDHLWYLYLAVGIYLVLPVFAPFFKSGSSKEIGILCTVSFLLSIVLPYAAEIFAAENAFYLPVSGYLFYVFLGGYLGKVKIPHGCVWTGVVLSVIAALILWFFPDFQEHLSKPYLSLPVCVMAVTVFAAAQVLLKDYHAGSWMRILSDCSWGVYLIHPLFLNVQLRLLGINPLSFPLMVSIPLNVFLLFFISAAAVYLTQRVTRIFFPVRKRKVTKQE